LVKMSTSKEREVNNGTHMIEDLELEEVEALSREAMAKATGETLMISLKKVRKSQKDLPSRKWKQPVKKFQLNSMKLLRKRLKNPLNQLKLKNPMKEKENKLSKNTLLRKRESTLRKKLDNTKK